MKTEKIENLLETGIALAKKYPSLDITTNDLNIVLKINEGNLYKNQRALYYIGIANGAITAKQKLKEREAKP